MRVSGDETEHDKFHRHEGKVTVLQDSPERVRKRRSSAGPTALCVRDLVFLREQAELFETAPRANLELLTSRFALYPRFDHFNELGDGCPYEPALADSTTNGIAENAIRNHIRDERS